MYHFKTIEDLKRAVLEKADAYHTAYIMNLSSDDPMLCVGFIEKVLFCGFLFKGMSKKHLVSAVIVSSLTFTLGHLAHLFDGSGVTLFANLCQVFGAISFGFVYRSTVKAENDKAFAAEKQSQKTRPSYSCFCDCP